MKCGDIFTVDAQALDETAAFTKVTLEALQSKVSVGDTFSISKSDKCNSNVIRGTRWIDGTPKKGRPRRFPRATVVRLLGEDDSAFETTQEATDASNQATEAAAVVALEERAAELLGDSPETSDAAVEVDTADSW